MHGPRPWVQAMVQAMGPSHGSKPWVQVMGPSHGSKRRIGDPDSAWTGRPHEPGGAPRPANGRWDGCLGRRDNRYGLTDQATDSTRRRDCLCWCGRCRTRRAGRAGGWDHGCARRAALDPAQMATGVMTADIRKLRPLGDGPGPTNAAAGTGAGARVALPTPVNTQDSRRRLIRRDGKDPSRSLRSRRSPRREPPRGWNSGLRCDRPDG